MKGIWLTKLQRIDQIAAYTAMVRDRLNQRGWTGSILTLMFKQLSGGEESIKLQMRETALQVYSAILKKMVRRPRSPNAVRPLLIGCPDFPVFKHEKQPLCDNRPNDGLHWNGVLLAPPDSRLKISVEQYFADKQQQFVADREQQYFFQDWRVLTKVHSEPFDSADVDDVTGYVLKSVKNFRSSLDDISVFPLSRVERIYRQE
jgi:hypothetical protein